MSELAPPRISRGRAAVTVVAGLALTGVVIGALWAWLAPSVHGVVALTKGGERVRAYLGNEADHFFVAAFLVVGMLCVVAVVAAVLVWQWRAHRGPLMVAALGHRGRWPRRVRQRESVRYWCIGATGRSMSAPRRFRPSIACTTSSRRRRCSSGTRRCWSP